MLAEPSVPALRASGVRRFLVEVERPVPRAVAVGLLLALDKAGVPFAVSPFGPFRFEGRMAPNGTEDAVLSVGGESSAWTDQRGGEHAGARGRSLPLSAPWRTRGAALTPADQPCILPTART